MRPIEPWFESVELNATLDNSGTSVDLRTLVDKVIPSIPTSRKDKVWTAATHMQDEACLLVARGGGAPREYDSVECAIELDQDSQFYTLWYLRCRVVPRMKPSGWFKGGSRTTQFQWTLRFTRVVPREHLPPNIAAAVQVDEEIQPLPQLQAPTPAIEQVD